MDTVGSNKHLYYTSPPSVLGIFWTHVWRQISTLRLMYTSSKFAVLLWKKQVKTVFLYNKTFMIYRKGWTDKILALFLHRVIQSTLTILKEVAEVIIWNIKCKYSFYLSELPPFSSEDVFMLTSLCIIVITWRGIPCWEFIKLQTV
jgi:hypothetical protein